MLSFLLFLLLLLVFSFKSKPDSSSFRSFLSQLPDGKIQKKSIAEQGTILGSLLSITGLASITTILPDFKCHDCIFFTLAILDDGSTFVGVWNTWFTWNGPMTRSQQEEQKVLEAEMTAETQIQVANRLKLQKDYKESAKGFIKASDVYLIAGGPINVIEAARALEEAFKCLKIAGEEESAYKILLKAADLLMDQPNTITKAAHLYQSIGQYEANLGRHGNAISLFLKSLQGLEASGETTNFSLKATLANSYVMQKSYDNAIHIYEILAKECTQDSALRFSLHRYLFAQLAASFASGNTQKTVELMSAARAEYPSFDGSQEHLLLLSMMASYQEGDFDTYNQRLDQIIRRDFGVPWIPIVFQNLKVDPALASYR